MAEVEELDARVAMLKKLAICRGLDDDQLIRLAKPAEVLRLNEGQSPLYTDTRDDRFFAVLSGKVRATFARGRKQAYSSIMREGDFFVTTGEVLIHSYAIEGSGDQRTVAADVEWTFPLEFVEVVWGDGQKIDRQVISATDLPPFGRKRFSIPLNAAGKSWVRFAVWDSAGNPGFVNAVWLRSRSQ